MEFLVDPIDSVEPIICKHCGSRKSCLTRAIQMPPPESAASDES